MLIHKWTSDFILFCTSCTRGGDLVSEILSCAVAAHFLGVVAGQLSY